MQTAVQNYYRICAQHQRSNQVSYGYQKILQMKTILICLLTKCFYSCK